MNNTRQEQDSIGIINVSKTVYWGAQTQRSLENFKIGSEKMPSEIIMAIALIKMSAAKANVELGILKQELGDVIYKVGEEILNKKLSTHFPLSVWQTGSGTQTNMNVNEVISNRAIEILGGEIGSKDPIHPNDHVNMGQSSNDTFPSAMHIALTIATEDRLLIAMTNLENTLKEKSDEFMDIIKIGRTHLQDATPLRLGDEFSAYTEQILKAKERIQQSLYTLKGLAQGGTAVGTGINCKNGFIPIFIKYMNQITKKDFFSANNKFAALSSRDDIVNLSGTLNTLATSLMKIANDIRLLGSGPRCGIAEIILPQNEPGSSIMPGKVNPTQCEALTMICCQVIGNHTSTSIAGSSGHLQLNVCCPIIAYNVLQSIDLLTTGIESFNNNCLKGIKANTPQIEKNLKNSLMLVTALNKHIGYDNSAKIAKNAYNKNISLEESAIELNILSSEEFREKVRPESMLGEEG